MIVCSTLAFLFCLLSAPSHAAVQGHVIDSNQTPIEGAFVTFTDESGSARSFSGYTDENGFYEIAITPASVSEDAPIQFQLGQNYPNPFNPVTTIPFSLDATAHVSLTVYNITGQRVAILVDTQVSRGNHSAAWNGLDGDGNHVSAGVYLYRLKAGRHAETRKMLLLDGGSFAGGAAVSAKSSYSAEKVAGETTYTVTVTHDSIIPYEETGVRVEDGMMRDFIVTIVGEYHEINGITFAALPGGAFQMGDETGDLDRINRPVHTVLLSPFAMGIHEVTNAQYVEYLNAAFSANSIDVDDDIVLGSVGTWEGQQYINLNNVHCMINFSGHRFFVDTEYENLPVVVVSWYGAKAFANFYGFDLPTEAEWEYACRGGRQYLYGTDDGTLDETKANFNGNLPGIIDVCSYPANPFGLYDMSGNVSEWCHDWFLRYTGRETHDPEGAKYATVRIVRGGCYYDEEFECRSSRRGLMTPGGSFMTTGFRVVRRSGGIIKNYRISGKVLFSGGGLEKTNVAIDNIIEFTFTDLFGKYTIAGFSDSTYTVTFSKDGYIFNPSSIEVTVNGSDVVVKDVIAIKDVTPAELTFLPIPGGTFNMGDEVGDLSVLCLPVHEVTVSDFEMSVYEITNKQYAEYLADALSSGDIIADSISVKGNTGEWSGQEYLDIDGSGCEISYRDGGFLVDFGKENRPVVRVTWYGAKAYANYYGYDLPTEAEWEYACRGGRQYLYGTDDGTITIGKAQFHCQLCFPVDVGSYAPNPFGLYDMSGNVSEWCHDWQAEYTTEPSVNPTGPVSGSLHVRRGGDWFNIVSFCRSAYRYYNIPVSSSNYTGFRVVRRPDGGIAPEIHRISGRILFNGSGLENVTVSMEGHMTYTGSDGSFSFTNLPDSTYTVTFSRDSYSFRPSSLEVTVNGSDMTVDDIIAEDAAIPVELTFVSIPGGTFDMGDVSGDLWNFCRPVHNVSVSDFEMGIYEITNYQYAEYLSAAFAAGDITVTGTGVTGTAGYWGNQNYIDIGHDDCEIIFYDNDFHVDFGKKNYPVTGVTWYGAKAFANFYGFDLPTEAEWEYACRGGEQHLYGTDDGTIDLTKANYNESTGNTVDVGSYPANPYGLYDMCGNVWEWCHDWYGSYSSEDVLDPVGIQYGTSRVMRGGFWANPEKYCRSSCRASGYPENSNANRGFRIVRRPGNIIHHNYTITGKVLLDGSGLEYVTVNIGNQTTSTDADGAFSFEGFADGFYTITLAKPGYTFSKSSMEVTVNGSNVIVDDITAEYTGDGEEFIDLTFVSIPGGTFMMGAETSGLPDDCYPAHEVTVSEFEMSICEVTNVWYAEYLQAALSSNEIAAGTGGVYGAEGEWNGKEYIDFNYSECAIRYDGGVFSIDPGMDNRPVSGVTWYGAKAYAAYYGYDLPTEAEWEYACRGGEQYLYGTDNGTIDMTKANYGNTVGRTTDVGRYPPNPFGMYDMCGNAFEWCHDYYGNYTSETVSNPTGPENGTKRILRGGSWNFSPLICRSCYRRSIEPTGNTSTISFRVVRRPDGLIY